MGGSTVATPENSRVLRIGIGGILTLTALTLSIAIDSIGSLGSNSIGNIDFLGIAIGDDRILVLVALEALTLALLE